MKKAFGITTLILGTVIGAGFASGKEICTFFVRFGSRAYPLAVLSGIVFFLGLYALLKVADLLPEQSGDAFHKALFGRGQWLGSVFSLTNTFLMTASMLGALAVLVPFGDLIGAALCFVVLLIGSKSVYRVNALAVPVIVVILLVVSLYGVFQGGVQGTIPFRSGGRLPAVLYSGMNLLTLGSVLCRERTTKKERLGICIASSVVVTALIVLQIVTIRACGVDAFSSALPLVVVGSKAGLTLLVTVSMGLGIFTTLCVCVYSESEWLAPLVGKKWIAILASLAFGYLVSRLGFDKIVETLYPVLGVLGLVLVGGCAVYLLRRQKNVLLVRAKEKHRRRGRLGKRRKKPEASC